MCFGALNKEVKLHLVYSKGKKKGKRKVQGVPQSQQTNARKALRLALSPPSEVIAILKGLKTQEQNDTRKDIQQIAS